MLCNSPSADVTQFTISLGPQNLTFLHSSGKKNNHEQVGFPAETYTLHVHAVE